MNIEAYVAAHVEKHRTSPMARAVAAAGENPMAHHKPRPVTAAGWAGAEQMFSGLTSSSVRKHQAGAAIVTARINRHIGNRKGTALALAHAAACRRQAQRCTQH